MNNTKKEIIQEFRKFADETLTLLNNTNMTFNEKASEINKKIKYKKDLMISNLQELAEYKNWDKQRILHEILLITYSSYIVMLEFRNRVWPYEYMAFARRIGELWEPFCKLVFEYSIKDLSIIDSPKFDNIQNQIKSKALNYIENLEISNEEKTELKNQYLIPWLMVDSGGIKLSLDLHFEQNGIHYNCDFKSGFSSNEKGNTNRLLLVASIYNSLGDIEKTLLFVRQPEDENNHYLQILKKSPYWQVYCSNNTYEIIEQFTGFNLKKWINDNIDWQNDIDYDFKKHLIKNDLIKYLTW